MFSPVLEILGSHRASIHAPEPGGDHKPEAVVSPPPEVIELDHHLMLKMIMMILMTKMILTVFSENRLWRQNCLACTSVVTNICKV